MDFFTVPTLTFGVLYCFFVIGHDQPRGNGEQQIGGAYGVWRLPATQPRAASWR